MSTKILVTEELKDKFNRESFIQKVEKNSWYYIKPFWYEENEFGTVSVYDKEEVPVKIKLNTII